LSIPVLHVVAGDAQASRRDFPEMGRKMLEAWGADLALHLRLKNAPASRLLDLASQLSGSAVATGGWCVVNERLDVALASGAQAVQLGRTALPVAIARAVIRRAQGAGPTQGAPRTQAGVWEEAGGGPALGASVHTEAEAREAVADGASYIVLGTIFASRTHPGVRPHGTAIVERCRTIGAPVIGIGGIDLVGASALRRAGASGVAVVRAVWGGTDPVDASGRLIRAWNDADMAVEEA
jgi:thiamine monophosphate synthase